MLVSDIYVDLPSVEATREMTRWERVQSRLTGAEVDLGTGTDVLLVDTVYVVETLFDVLRQLELTDVISVLVDRRVLYLDGEQHPDDLEEAWDQAVRRGLLSHDLHELRLILEHQEADLHAIVDVGVRTPVRHGTEELHVRLHARVERLQVRPGESARQYDERVRRFAADLRFIEAYRVLMREFARRVAIALRDAMPDTPVRLEPTWVRVVRPEREHLARMRDLRFRHNVVVPYYRPAPTVERKGVFDDTYGYFYFDPYFMYLNWILLDTMLWDRAWRSEDVQIVEAGGTPFCSADQIERHADSLAWMHHAIAYDEDGDLVLSASIPIASFSGDPLEDWSMWTVDDPRRT